MKLCAYDKCDIWFEPTTHNMKYHSDLCCKLATNERIMRKYYERKAGKAARAGTTRICVTPGCQTVLSRYNEHVVCQKCEAEIRANERRALKNKLLGNGS